MDLVNAEQTLGPQFERLGHVLRILGRVFQLQCGRGIIRDAGDDCVQLRLCTWTPGRRLDDQPGAAAGKIPFLVPGDDLDVVVFAWFERRSIRQINGQVGFFRPRIDGRAAGIGEQFLAVDKNLHLADACAVLTHGEFEELLMAVAMG